MNFSDSEHDISSFVIDEEEFKKRWISEHTELQILFSKLNETVQKEAFEQIRKLIIKIIIELQKRPPTNTKTFQEAQVAFLTSWNSEP